jgi:hypothetical protein
VSLAHAPAFHPSYRLIPSRFPPIGLFDTVATAADLDAVMELAGWTNDRLVAERVARLPQAEWIFGRANSSIVMAAFLHAAPTGARFNSRDLGAWYASADIKTAAAEVGHHLRREAVARRIPTLSRTYRAYSARLDGTYIDIRGRQSTMPELYAPDDYQASQAFGENLRKRSETGLLYDSVRFTGGVNAAVFRPIAILDVTQADHFEIAVAAEAKRIEVRKLSAA